MVALATAIGFLAGCGDAEPPGVPNVRHVVLITLDTTRDDALGRKVGEADLTPNLSKLAREGLRFERAYTPTPLTLPAHASLLTGLIPPRHGLRENGMQPLSQAADTLAERLSANGFRTAAFVSARVLDRFFGLDQGFERYDEPGETGEMGRDATVAESGYLERRARDTVERALDWLIERKEGERVFLWVHLFDPHVPYVPEDEFLQRAGGDAYLGEVAAMDDALGRLFDELDRSGRADETLVVVAGDHGEALGEHGEPTHGALCYESTARVPLILSLPPAVASRSRAHPRDLASLVDLYPTILSSLELPIPSGLDGIDLLAGQAPPEHGIYLEAYSGYFHYGWSPLVGWRDARGKYLHSPCPEYYEVDRDAGERDDLLRKRPRQVEAALEAISLVLSRPALPDEGSEGSARFAEDLRRLGYAHMPSDGSPLASPLEETERPCPKDRARELIPMLQAHNLYEAGRADEALALVDPLLRQNPGNLLALELKSHCLLAANRFDEARPVLEERLRRGPGRADVHLNLALCLEQKGEIGAAIEALEAALRIDPSDETTRSRLAELELRR